MLFGYNTNGFAFHPLTDAIDILSALGYSGVGITLDYHCLNPFSDDVDRQTDEIAGRLDQKRLRCVVETGARFLLDPWNKHQPTLLSPEPNDRQRRIDFLCRSIRIAKRLNADAVSFWSGRPTDDASPGILEDRLAESLKPVIDEAERYEMMLALEPEPGMHLATVTQAQRLIERLDRPLLQLTVDVGHLHCQQEGNIPNLLQAVAPKLANVHIEDMRTGVHDHLMFGEGEIDFPPILKTLREIGYANGVYVELSRHAHDAVSAARQSLAFLQAAFG